MNEDLTLTGVRRIRNLEEITPYVMACRSSGLTCKEWCRQNNIPVTTYYGWQKRVFNAVKKDQAVEFAELVPISNTESINTVATISVRGLSLNLLSGIDSETVTAIVRGLSNV